MNLSFAEDSGSLVGPHFLCIPAIGKVALATKGNLLNKESPFGDEQLYSLVIG
jgi:hypothetical protein